MRFLARAVLHATAFSSTALLICFIVFSYGPGIETRRLPVFSDVRATSIEVDEKNNVLRLAATAMKVRQCEWKGIVAMVERDGYWHAGKVFFTDPRQDEPSTELPMTRPPGLQTLGEIFVFPYGEKVRVYTYHQCHPFWQTLTPLYELDFSKKPAQVTLQ